MMIATVLLAGCGAPIDDFSTPAPDTNVGQEPTGRILFVSDGNVAMWDGEVHQLTEDITAMSPTWAPAGDRFAYVQMHDGYSDIILAENDGDTLINVTNNEPDAEPFSEEFACFAYWALDPVWSPTREQLTWVSDRGGWEFDICENRVSDPMFLWFSENLGDPDLSPYLLQASLDINQSQESPTFSPDGNQVAFVVRTDVSETFRNTEIWTLALDGGQHDPLVVSNEPAYDPAWSPDGNNIAYIQRTGTSNDVWIAPLDGSAPYQLTQIGRCVGPVWSPDGRFLAFFTEDGGSFKATYVEVTVGSDGRLTAGEPQELFSADSIDASSGMSWIGD